jgi:hypothetical protein
MDLFPKVQTRQVVPIYDRIRSLFTPALAANILGHVEHPT